MQSVFGECHSAHGSFCKFVTKSLLFSVIVRWNSRVVLHVMSMMRDIALSSEELSHVIAKSLRQLTEMERDELPPLVYQLLLLSAKVRQTSR